MPQNLTDDKSTLVQVMAWCHQAASHYLNQCWPRSQTPYGATRPQWVNWLAFPEYWQDLAWLTCCGQVTPHGNSDMGQHWLLCWQHQAIIWTYVELSLVQPCTIHLWAVSWEVLRTSICKMSLKITFLEFLPHFSKANELTHWGLVTPYGDRELGQHCLR